MIAVVCIEGWEQMLWAYAKQFDITKLKHAVPSGDTGQISIRSGLCELERYYSPDNIVPIHDVIRPMVVLEIISYCLMKTRQYGSTMVVIPYA